jgi:hypothetical protein
LAGYLANRSWVTTNAIEVRRALGIGGILIPDKAVTFGDTHSAPVVISVIHTGITFASPPCLEVSAYHFFYLRVGWSDIS